jgi:hypothetical protein
LPSGSLNDLKGRYLLDSHVVSYAPSATVLYLIRNSPMTHAPTLAFLGAGDVEYGRHRTASNKNSGSLDSASTVPSADPFDLTGGRFSDLPSTRDEVIAASQVFREKRLLLGPDATEATFKAQPLAEFDITHIRRTWDRERPIPGPGGARSWKRCKVGRRRFAPSARDQRPQPECRSGYLSASDSGVGPLEGEEGIANLVRGSCSPARSR